MGQPGFWDNAESATKISQQLNDLKESLKTFQDLSQRLSDINTLLELALEENDTSLEKEINEMFYDLKKDIEKLDLLQLFSEEYDKNNAILTLHAGAGGTEAQDWVQMLYRMFLRWAEQKKCKVEVLDFLAGDEAGIKSASILISGINSYGYLKSEKGVHRLVRISPFDANKKRHTSFAAVDVMPEIDDSIEIDLDMTDIRVDTYRASGAGGQHINKTDSAVRMTHIPTGLVAQCQSERSQIQNREKCLKFLKAKFFMLKKEEQEEKMSQLGGEYQAIEWGSQIRSYVFHPYNLVKDHRTSEETGNIQFVMDGGIDIFIEAYLRSKLK